MIKKITVILALIFVAASFIACEKEEVEEENNDDNNEVVEDDFRDEYVGSYLITDSTFTPDGNVDIQTKTVEVTKHPDAENKINLSGIFDNVVSFAKISDSTLVFPTQYSDDAQQQEVSGIGSFNGIELYYRLNMDNNTIIIIGRGDKQ